MSGPITGSLSFISTKSFLSLWVKKQGKSLHFFELKKQGKSLWVSLSNIPGRVLLSLFQQSFKGWKGKFFKVCCSDYDPSALDGFPLYWVNEVKTMKSKSLDELPSNDREACKILTSVGGFDTATLISLDSVSYTHLTLPTNREV